MSRSGAARGVEALGDRIVDFSVARSGRVVAVREIDPGAQRRPMRSKGRFRIGYSRQPA
jgi:hypothetical protein